MENRPIISLVFRSPAPGADPEVWNRFQKWNMEVYTPLAFKHPFMEAWDYYHIVVESPEYPLAGNIVHTESIEDAESWMKTPENKGIADDMADWVKRGIVEYFWNVRYELKKASEAGLFLPLKRIR